jgi:CheY-like chemotaxis protein
LITFRSEAILASGADCFMRTHKKTLVLPPSSDPAILLAEDDANDVILLRFAMGRMGLRNPVFAVSDGAEALEYLNGFGRYAGHPVPKLLLLDLKMPRLDGFGVLAWLQFRPQFNGIAKVVLSSSNLQSDIDRAMELGADEYLVKPTEIHDLGDLLLGLHNRWLARWQSLSLPVARLQGFARP